MKSLLLCALASVALVDFSQAQAPSNDECPGFGAVNLNGGGFINFRQDTANATDSALTDSGQCSLRPPNIKDVFFIVNTSVSGYYRIETMDHTTIGYDTVMTAYSGFGCDPNACIAYNDDISATNYGSVLELYVEVGDYVTIQVGAWSSSVAPVDTNRIEVTVLDVPGDTCDTAIPISGYGDFDYSNEFHTISAFPLGGCQSVGEDVYLEWTAPASASNSQFKFRFQPEPGFDHEVYSYSTCNGVCISVDHANGCNGSTEQLFVGIDAGEKIIFKVAGYDVGDKGTGVLTVLDPACDPCTQNDSYEDNDTCDTAVDLPDQDFSMGYWLDPADNDYYKLCVANNGTVDITLLFDHLAGDVDAYLYDAAGLDCLGAVAPLVVANSSTDDETIFWNNTTGASVDLILHVFLYQGATGCTNYDVMNVSSACGGDMTTFCDPAPVNSTGSPAVLSGEIDSLYPGTGLHLEVTGGVPGEIGYFVVGSNSSEPGISFGNGFLCMELTAGNIFGRYNVSQSNQNSIGFFDATGTLINLAGTSAIGSGFDVPNQLPISGSPTILPGQTFHFQLWYRDTPAGSGSSNLTNGLSVVF